MVFTQVRLLRREQVIHLKIQIIMCKINEIGLGCFVSARNEGKTITLFFEHGKVLQSYNTIVAANVRGTLYLSPAHDCSNTTCRHVKGFCGLSSKERIEGLEDGTIKQLDI